MKQKILTDMLSRERSRSRARTSRSQTPNSWSSVKRLGKWQDAKRKRETAPDTEIDYYDFTPSEHITPETGQE